MKAREGSVLASSVSHDDLADRAAGLVSHKTGIVVHDPRPEGSHEVRSWGRKMALYKECGDNVFRVPAYHADDNEKKYKKFIRKNARFLKELFGSDANVLSIGQGEHGLRVCLDEDVCRIVLADIRSEIYLPMAYEKNGVVVGGMYAYLWRCGPNDLATVGAGCSLPQRPVTSIVTGMCMFGADIWGIDRWGLKHPLTNTFYSIPQSSKVETIFLESDDLHPYENMMLRLFDLQLPMLKAMGNGRQKLFFQSVFEEYVLYGVQVFLLGKMTLPALCAYVDHVGARALEIRRRVAEMCERHGLDFDGGRSTLAVLFGGDLLASDMRGDAIVEKFLELQEIDLAALDALSGDRRLHFIERVFWRGIERLAAQPGSDGEEVWQHVEQVLLNHVEAKSEQYDFTSLLTLNFLNYAAKVAVVRKDNPEGELCLSHPFHEKPMALAYKELHAEKCGSILSLNWVPPIFSHGSFKDGLYYLERDKGVVNELIRAGVLESCGLEIGAEAAKDAELKAFAAEQVDAILRSSAPV